MADDSLPAPCPPHVSRHIERERRRLNKAVAVLAATIVAAEQDVDCDLIADCCRVCHEFVQAAISALDRVSLSRLAAGGGSDA